MSYARMREFVLDVKARPDHYKDLAGAYYLIGAPFCMFVLLLAMIGLTVWSHFR